MQVKDAGMCKGEGDLEFYCRLSIMGRIETNIDFNAGRKCISDGFLEFKKRFFEGKH